MPQVQVWINNDDTENVSKLVKNLNENVVAKKDKNLKAFFIFVSEEGKALESKLTEMADKQQAHDLALAYVPKSDASVEAYKVNLDPEVKNTVIVYRNKRVTAKFVNLKADEKGLAELKAAIDGVTQ